MCVSSSFDGFFVCFIRSRGTRVNVSCMLGEISNVLSILQASTATASDTHMQIQVPLARCVFTVFFFGGFDTGKNTSCDSVGCVVCCCCCCWTRLNEMECVWPQLTTMQRQPLRQIGGRVRLPPPPSPRQLTPVSHRGLIPDVSGRPPKTAPVENFLFSAQGARPRLLERVAECSQQ